MLQIIIYNKIVKCYVYLKASFNFKLLDYDTWQNYVAHFLQNWPLSGGGGGVGAENVF